MFKASCPKNSLKALLLTAVLASALVPFSIASAAPAVQFEQPKTYEAKDLLPPELLSGPHFKVRDRVISSGYMHIYTVDSDYGVFEVTGDFALRRMIREIGAIASLQEAKKGEAYLGGIKAAAMQPIEFGRNLVTDPVDTVSGVPKGIAALFMNVNTAVTKKANPSEDSKVEQLLAVSSVKRMLANKLGVDVYTSNKALQKEMNGMAWAATLGSLTVSAALTPVGGPAVTAVSMTSTAQQLNDYLAEYPPQKLRQVNTEKLTAMGISEDLANRFLDAPGYTPTHETVIVNALETLSGAKGRDAFIRYILPAEDEETAFYFQYVAETMRDYQKKVAPIEEITAYGLIVFARASNGTVIIPMPLDDTIKTESALEAVSDAMLSYKAMNPKLKKYEMWLTGTASKPAKEEMAKLGIKPVEQVGKQVDLTY